MIGLALGVGLASAGLFGALALMSDRPRGAVFAQIGAVVSAILLFVALVLQDALAALGVPARALSALGVALLAASVVGMLYHLYLGRFISVWAARGVFTVVFLLVSALFGAVYLSLF
jgi:hypothetical protein